MQTLTRSCRIEIINENPPSENRRRRTPKGFEQESQYTEYLRLKAYCLLHTPTNEFVCADNLAPRVAELFRLTQPFLHYINRAIAYVKEEG